MNMCYFPVIEDETGEKLKRECRVKVCKKIRVWKKPDEGWLKINTDAAIFCGGNMGMWSVIRDSRGCFIGQDVVRLKVLEVQGRLKKKPCRGFLTESIVMCV